MRLSTPHGMSLSSGVPHLRVASGCLLRPYFATASFSNTHKESATMFKKILRRLVLGFVCLVLGLVLLLVLGSMALSLWAPAQENAVNQAWGQTLIDLRTLPSRFPPTRRNTTAHLLLDMITHARSTFSQLPVEKSCRTFIFEELERPTDDTLPLPEEVQGYLQAHAPRLTELYQQVEAEPPHWDFDLKKRVVPNFIDHRDLTYLIACDILEKTRQGHTREALAAFAAAWQSNASLRKGPKTISQALAMGVDTVLAKVLRKMHDVPPIWQQRLLEHDYYKALQMVVAVRAWAVSDAYMRGEVFAEVFAHQENTQSVVLDRLESLFERSAATWRKPLWRLAGVNILEAIRQGVLVLQQHDLCSMELDAASTAVHQAYTWWNPFVLGEEKWGLDLLPRAGKTMLTLEATQKILYVKERRGMTQQSTLLTAAPHLGSALCPGAYWEYHAMPDGTFTLTWSTNVPWLQSEGERAQQLLVVQWGVPRQ